MIDGLVGKAERRPRGTCGGLVHVGLDEDSVSRLARKIPVSLDRAVVFACGTVKLDPDPRGALEMVGANKPDGSDAFALDVHAVANRKGSCGGGARRRDRRRRCVRYIIGVGEGDGVVVPGVYV